MPQILLAGGPHDGLILSTSLGATFLWHDGRRAHRGPGAGRSLYRLTVKKRGQPDRYEFIGHDVTLCECGAYRPKDAACPLCGAS
jgi:hypothetical protein